MTTAPSRSQGSALRHARHLLERGTVPPPGMLDATVARSWQRSVEAGLMPFGRPNETHLLADGLARAVERRHHLLTRARPVLEYLHAQTRDSGSMVLLADDRGFVLDALGDADFMDRAGRVALRPGASWHEHHRGTNAIGTALAEGAAVTVHGGEHFLERNTFLTCSAAPLAGPDGVLLGALDISGHCRSRGAHTASLVLVAAHMIENRLFEAFHATAAARLRVHPQASGIGTVAEGLVALDGGGRIVGINRAGAALLRIAPEDLGGIGIEEVLDLRLADLLGHALTPPGGVAPVRRRDGKTLFLRLDGETARPVSVGGGPRRSAAATVRPADALATLDTGDAGMAQLIARARKVADKPIPLLLHGESGAGKEVLARAIHASGPRRAGCFVAINCAALPEQLIEAELFGYAPGAFTGARRDGSPGRIREARGGTLFLDEIADMPLPLQARLLRVLQDGEVSPLGGGKPEAVDFALMAACHRPLKAEVEAGRFRADLYYRINGLTLTLPPLRDRGDIALLIRRMLDDLAPGGGLVLAPAVAEAFATHRWPGNLRQMSHALRAAWALLDPGETVIDWHHLPEDLSDDLRCRPSPVPMPSIPVTDGSEDDAGPSLRRVSDSFIRQTVEASGGNMSEAARRLGISRNTLYRRLQRSRH